MVRFSTQHCCAKNRYRVTWQPNLLQQRCRNLKSVQSCATRCDNNCCIKNHLQTPCYTYRFFCATKIVVLQFPDWSPVSRLVPQFPDSFPSFPIGSPVSRFPGWFPSFPIGSPIPRLVPRFPGSPILRFPGYPTPPVSLFRFPDSPSRWRGGRW